MSEDESMKIFNILNFDNQHCLFYFVTIFDREMHIRVYAEKRVKQRIFAIHTHLSLCLIVLANF